jgi:hypothetical protein
MHASAAPGVPRCTTRASNGGRKTRVRTRRFQRGALGVADVGEDQDRGRLGHRGEGTI